eukprot:715306-Amorphochlora_amoeboformis.AAC.1
MIYIPALRTSGQARQDTGAGVIPVRWLRKREYSVAPFPIQRKRLNSRARGQGPEQERRTSDRKTCRSTMPRESEAESGERGDVGHDKGRDESFGRDRGRCYLNI